MGIPIVASPTLGGGAANFVGGAVGAAGAAADCPETIRRCDGTVSLIAFIRYPI
jgi:hypothetical protein